MLNPQKAVINSASFRDPSGFVFKKDGAVFRQINPSHREHYHTLMNSGLYQELIDRHLLVPHQEVESNDQQTDQSALAIKPDEVAFISYPYEWCFQQLKDAALVTLEIQSIALRYGMFLKDASAFNIQFMGSRPVLIDTLSLANYPAGSPWVAYRQFCQHFLAPLALARYSDVRLLKMLSTCLDGIPLGLVSRLLPTRTWLKPGLLTHIHLHAQAQKKHLAAGPVKMRQFSQQAMLGLIDSLMSTVKSLNIKTSQTEWSDYYQDLSYSEGAFIAKKNIVSEFLDQAGVTEASVVWDLGANTGMFSEIAGQKSGLVVAVDSDMGAVEKLYQRYRETNSNSVPLSIDLANPSPDLGWAHRERLSLARRGPADVVMVLALVHHLRITAGIPLAKQAEFFSKLGNWLIIEFVPRGDGRVQTLLKHREDIFNDYSKPAFEETFTEYFELVTTKNITDSTRILYLMKKKP